LKKGLPNDEFWWSAISNIAIEFIGEFKTEIENTSSQKLHDSKIVIRVEVSLIHALHNEYCIRKATACGDVFRPPANLPCYDTSSVSLNVNKNLRPKMYQIMPSNKFLLGKPRSCKIVQIRETSFTSGSPLLKILQQCDRLF
jgi:hypothetical protein